MGLDNDRFRLEGHTAWLLMLPTTNIRAGVTGVISFGINQRSNDLHSIYGENPCGRKEKVVLKSPGKNVEGLMGGVITIMIASLIIGPLLTPLNTYGIISGFVELVLVVFAAMS
ncbi:phosphatidate cytidylyltransferase [Shigella flexneri]